MFLIHFHRLKRSGDGYVADVCPHCRGVREFRLVDLSLVPYVMFIPIGSGTPAGQIAVCGECRSELTVKLSQYSGVRAEMGAPISELVERCSRPSTLARAEAAARLSHRLATGELTREDRVELAFVAITRLGMQPDAAQSYQLDRGIVLAIAAALISFGLMWLLTIMQPTASNDLACCGLGVILAGSLIAIPILIVTRGSRYVAGQLEPRIAQDLETLPVDDRDFESAREHAISQGFVLARLIKVQRIRACIAQS